MLTIPSGPYFYAFMMHVDVESLHHKAQYPQIGSKGAIDVWGHEYMRHLAGEIGDEYRIRKEAEADTQGKRGEG
eukprot:100937-Pelagomonas_calceolata.AAC.7